MPAFPVFPSPSVNAGPATSAATVTCQNPSAAGEKRLSVAYLLNSDEPPMSTSTTIPPTFLKQEQPSSPELHHQPKRKAPSSSKAQKSHAKRSRTASTSSSSSSPLATRPSSLPAAATTSTTTTTTAMAATFKGDLSLFPHLQLQLQREQLDPQQHTELVLKVWNRQQQVLKLQQLQQKKQELKAQRLQQRLQRKGHGKAVVESTPGSPPTSSSTASPSSPTPASPPSSTSSADVVSAALPTLDEILNGADAQVDEASDEDWSNNNSNSNMKKKTNSSSGGADAKKPRRRITAQQVAVLEQVFAVEPFPGPSTKKVIAKKLGMQERSITIWFQNKRARLKRIEGGHGDNNNGGSNEGEGGRREVTFHNLAVGFDGKLDMLPEDF